jgi:hypothetical protein
LLRPVARNRGNTEAAGQALREPAAGFGDALLRDGYAHTAAFRYTLPKAPCSSSTTCPVKAVKVWLEAAGLTEGPIFRPVAKAGRLGTGRLSGKSVCTLVQTYADRLGLEGEAFGAHSLRSGFLTSAARRGANVFKMRLVAGSCPGAS